MIKKLQKSFNRYKKMNTGAECWNIFAIACTFKYDLPTTGARIIIVIYSALKSQKIREN